MAARTKFFSAINFQEKKQKSKLDKEIKMKTLGFLLLCLLVLQSSMLFAQPNFKIPLPASDTAYYLTVEFGGRQYDGGIDYYHTKESGCYYALDFDGNIGDPIITSAPGTIMEVGQSSCLGKYVIIDHGNSWTTHYYHLYSFSVGKNEFVSNGREIGKMGNTGCSTAGEGGDGSHLHISYKYEGKCDTDPGPISGYTDFVAGKTYRSDNDPFNKFLPQGSSSLYLPVFQAGYDRFKGILGQPVSNEVFELSWYPGILVKEYRNGSSALSFRDHSGYALLVLDTASGNDFWPVR